MRDAAEDLRHRIRRAIALVDAALRDPSDAAVRHARKGAKELMPIVAQLIARGRVTTETLVDVAELNAILIALRDRLARKDGERGPVN
jgi:hypothetical protein